jgi:hypothetical protein
MSKLDPEVAADPLFHLTAAGLKQRQPGPDVTPPPGVMVETVIQPPDPDEWPRPSAVLVWKGEDGQWSAAFRDLVVSARSRRKAITRLNHRFLRFGQRGDVAAAWNATAAEERRRRQSAWAHLSDRELMEYVASRPRFGGNDTCGGMGG